MKKIVGETVTLVVEVTRTFFTSPTFSAGRMKGEDGSVFSFSGKVQVKTGDQIKVKGHWVEDPKYGIQLKVLDLAYDMPESSAGLAQWLAKNRDFKGVGPVKAAQIADAFTVKEWADALTSDEGRAKIMAVAKLTEDRVAKIAESWTANSAWNGASSWLAQFGLTFRQIKTLVGKFGNNAIAILQQDPYQIIDFIDGYGFKRADEIALAMGTPKDHPGRLRACFLHLIKEDIGNGHTVSLVDDLMRRAVDSLAFDDIGDMPKPQAKLASMVQDGDIYQDPDEPQKMTLTHIWERERDLADILTGGWASPKPCGPLGTRPITVDGEQVELTPGQLDAVNQSLTSGMSVITGGAGTGKTFLVKVLCHLWAMGQMGHITLCAPTGKAAKRLGESTGWEASTIHRLLGYDGRGFSAEGPLAADLVVVDEVSMVDSSLLFELLSRLDLTKTTVVLVGDPNQLPPVGPGNPLRDVINTGALPVVALAQCVRQAGVLKENCLAVLGGTLGKSAPPEGDDPVDGVWPWVKNDHLKEVDQVLTHLDELYRPGGIIQAEWGLDPLWDVQLLSPTRKGPIGVNALNGFIRDRVQEAVHGRSRYDMPETKVGWMPKPVLGDKVIQRKNDYNLGVMNGDLGVVVSMDKGEGIMGVQFYGHPDVKDLDRSQDHWNHVDLAYALTIHQVQGSEFTVALVLAHKQHMFMLSKSLIYTGVTRAKRGAYLVGDNWGMRTGASKNTLDQRRTWLSGWLAGEGVQTLDKVQDTGGPVVEVCGHHQTDWEGPDFHL